MTAVVRIGRPPAAPVTHVPSPGHARHARPCLARRGVHAVGRLSTTRTIRVVLLTAALLEASAAGGWMAALGVTGTGLVLAGNAVLLLVAGAVIR